jgi:serine/threonine-protein kinase
VPTEERTATASDALVPAERTPLLGVGATVCDRYELRAVVGRGAQGTVFRAWDRATRDEVALKLLHGGEARHELDALAHELRCARASDHPNVCRMHDIVVHGDHAFLVMQLATGPLEVARSAVRARPLSARLSDARDIATGLAAIHGAGLLHGDLKPGNILRMPDGRLAVSDFGLARRLDATITTRAAGTPGYIAPEVAIGEPRTTASDVWSLGVVLHELLLGARRPGSAPRGTPRALAALCAECVAADPRARPDASTIAERLADPGVARTSRSRVPWAMLSLAAFVVGASVLIGRTASRVPELDANASFPFAEDVRCLETLPGGRTVWVITQRPAAAFDLDLTTGARQPARLVPEALTGSWPRLSPDGRALAFALPSYRIMLASPDGSGARTLAHGSSAVWLADGRALFVQMDESNVGIVTLDGSVTVLSQPSPSRRVILAIAAGDTGKLAVLSRSMQQKYQLDAYDGRTGALLRSTQFPSIASGLWYDTVARSFEVALRDREGLGETAVAVTSGGRLVPRVRVGSGFLLAGTSTALGPLLHRRTENSSSIYRTGPGGHEELVLDHGNGIMPTVSDEGQVLTSTLLPDGRVVIALLSRGRLKPLTEGPSDWRPRFTPRGRDFIFIDSARNAIRHCAWSGPEAVRCRDVAVDPAGVESARQSPDGQWVAYTTVPQASMRLRLVSINGGQPRDLGPVLDTGCAINWSSDHAVWLGDAAAHAVIELDVSSEPARPTGRRIEDPNAGNGCPKPPPAENHPPSYTVRLVSHRGQDTLVLSAL